MNAKDLENINWTLLNGQPEERVQLLSLLSQILQLTSNAVVNRRRSSPIDRFRISINDDQRVLHRRTELTHEMRGSNDNHGSSRNTVKPTDDGRNIAALQHAFAENNQSHRISQGADKDDEMFQEHHTSDAYNSDADMFPEIPTASGSSVISKQPSSNPDTNKIGKNNKEFDISYPDEKKTRGLQPESSSRNCENSFNLNELLQSDACADIIKYYRENGHLDMPTQKILMQTMCTELLKGPRVSNETINRISKDVCMVFLTEEKKEYYDHQPRRNPTGKFYNMYKHQLKNENPPSNPRKRKAMDKETDDLDSNIFSEKIKESVVYLKDVHDDADADNGMVIEHWSASFNYRRATLRNKTYKNVTQAIEEWPIIKTNYGFNLMDFDFQKDHGPLCANSLVTNWKYIVQIAEDIHNMISKCNKKTKSSLAKLPSDNGDYDNVVLAKSLHYLAPPSAVSMVMSQKSFYQFATNTTELEEKIKSLIEHWKVNDIDPHPIIFGVKDNSSVRYVVVMNELRIRSNDFLHAFDAAFKMFNFFNIAYPTESLKFWSIISVLLYGLNNDLYIAGKLCTVIKILKIHIKKAKTPPRRSKSSPANKQLSQSRSRSRSKSHSRSRSRSHSVERTRNRNKSKSPAGNSASSKRSHRSESRASRNSGSRLRSGTPDSSTSGSSRRSLSGSRSRSGTPEATTSRPSPRNRIKKRI